MLVRFETKDELLMSKISLQEYFFKTGQTYISLKSSAGVSYNIGNFSVLTLLT